MYPPMDLDGVRYFVKPMNCPMHHKIYGSKLRSYRDLPVRLAEYGTCYRYEKSGELFGLMRVRSMQMNDAHIYCSEEQFEQEFMGVIDLYRNYFDLFEIDKYVMRLSTHHAKGLGKKYVDNERLWLKTEEMVRRAMINGGVPFVEVPDEAAFYGPKIDVQIWSAIGREFTLATNQVDFAVPPRFDLTYVNADGNEETPLCIHRAPLSTHERMIGFLIEHYAGALPGLAGARNRCGSFRSPAITTTMPSRLDSALDERGRTCDGGSQQRAHECQDSRGPADEGALHAGGGRSGDGRGHGGAAQARRLAPEWAAGRRVCRHGLSASVSQNERRTVMDAAEASVSRSGELSVVSLICEQCRVIALHREKFASELDAPPGECYTCSQVRLNRLTAISV